MDDQHRASIVCILNANGKILGGGVLVTENRIITCAHVVAKALGIPKETSEMPDGEIHVGFPLVSRGRIINLPSRVIFWNPVTNQTGSDRDSSVFRYGSDIAILKLKSDPPAESLPGKLVEMDNLWKHSFRAFGFPAGYDNGVFARGVILDKLENGWVQIEGPEATGFFVTPGFSGTPVWNDDVDGIIGMVVASESISDVRTAYIIPDTLLFDVYPELGHLAFPPCPYRSLSAFREENSPFFFGRENFTKRLVKAVKKRPFVAVIGNSGAGKSSLVSAGLIPVLRAEQTWLIASFRPEDRPFFKLSSSLYPFLRDDQTPKKIYGQFNEKRDLARKIREEEDAFKDIIKGILEKNPSSSSLLLFIDQFEEIFTLCEDEEERQCFLDRLLGAIKKGPHKPKPDITLVITLRSDFLGHVTTYRPLADAIQDASLILSPMNRQEMKAAIERPASKLNVRIEDGLTERILDAISRTPGNLPLLEFTLTRLWKVKRSGRLLHAAYNEIGGVERSLTNHADEVYGKFTDAEKKQVRKIFRKLVQPGEGTEDIRRIIACAEMGEENLAIAGRLADDHLVVMGWDEARGEETLEIVHEALTKEWNTLRAWIDADRAFLMWHKRLRIARRQWKACNRDEGALLHGAPLAEAEDWLQKRREDLSGRERIFIEKGIALREKKRSSHERLRRNIILGVSLALLIVSILATWALLKWRESERQKQIALARLLVTHSESVRNLQPNLLTYSVLIATEAMKRLLKAKVPSMEADQVLRQGLDLLPRHLTRMIHEQDVRTVTFSPDGEYLASADSDGTIRLWLWRMNSVNEIARMSHQKVTAIAFTPYGGYLASAGDDNMACLWKVPGGRKTASMPHGDHVTALAFSPFGEYLATASADKTITLWEVPGGREIMHMTHDDYVSALAFSPDGEHLVTASWDMTVRVWKVENGREIARMPHGNDVTAVAFSPDGRHVITAEIGKDVHVWDISTEKEIAMMSHDEDVISGAFSPDGRYLATICNDRTIHLWQIDTRQEISRIPYQDQLTTMVFSPEGEYLATASLDSTARLWDVRSGKELIRIDHGDAVNTVIFSPEGKYLATASRDCTARVWKAASIRKDNCMVHNAEVYAVKISPDGRFLATAGRDHTTRIWEIDSCREQACLSHEWPMQAIAFSPDGKYLATASGDHRVRLWETREGEECHSMEHDTGVFNVVFSPDGRFIATVDSNQDVVIWRTITHRPITSPMPHKSHVTALTFSPKGRYLATATRDGFVHIWSTLNGIKIGSMGHADGILAMCFDPDGDYLATISRGARVRLWHTVDQKESLHMSLDGEVIAAAFSQDGTRLATKGKDHTLYIWDMDNRQRVGSMKHDKDHTLHKRNMDKCQKAGLMKYDTEILHFTFTPDGSRIATIGRDQTVRVWYAASNGREITRMDHEKRVLDIDLSPDGKRLVTANANNVIRVWDAGNDTELFRMIHPGDVKEIIFSPDGKCFATITKDDPYVRIWDAGNGDEITCMKHAWQVNHVDFSPDGKHLVTGSDDRTARIWETRSGKEILRINHKKGVKALVYCPDPKKRYIATISNENYIARLWDTSTGNEALSLSHLGSVNALNFSPDGKYIAAACTDRYVQICETSTGKEVNALPHKKGVKVIAFSPDGRWIATACGDPDIWVWERSTGKGFISFKQEFMRNKKKHHSGVDILAFSRDGRYLASGSIEGIAWVWDMEKGREVSRLEHKDLLNAIAFSPDSDYLATASNDCTARVWKIINGQEITRMKHEKGVNSVIFSLYGLNSFNSLNGRFPDGKYIITASSDQTARKWLWQPQDMITEACSRISRNLTRQEWEKHIGRETYRRTCPELCE